MDQTSTTYCECLEKCPFFNDNMADMMLVTDLMKTKYCKGAHWECARYMVFKARGREHVPADLFPNETYRAFSLLKNK